LLENALDEKVWVARDSDAELRPISKPIAAFDFRVISLTQKLQVGAPDGTIPRSRFIKGRGCLPFLHSPCLISSTGTPPTRQSGKGNDKGKVEGLVGYARRNFMAPAGGYNLQRL